MKREVFRNLDSAPNISMPEQKESKVSITGKAQEFFDKHGMKAGLQVHSDENGVALETFVISGTNGQPPNENYEFEIPSARILKVEGYYYRAGYFDIDFVHQETGKVMTAQFIMNDGHIQYAEEGIHKVVLFKKE